jgi:hypothetical protein
MRGAAKEKEVPTISEVKKIDRAKQKFDGKKADVYINTGQLGRTFLVKVTRADGTPALIAMHL